ncbi:MAG: D-alanine--D-alanine ligase [Myxococcales bacterium]|nr:D-alanine--D-alanine ligase [Myxococcales bacterium]
MGHTLEGRIVVAFNRDFEEAKGDPENRAREDVVGTARDVASALAAAGFEVETLGVTDDVGAAVDEIASLAPDAVFNLCESFGGEGRFEAVFPLLLDLSQLAFTGSTAPTLMLAVHKDRTKQILQACGVCTPASLRVDGPSVPSTFEMPGPMIVKPSREDASVGISNDSVVATRAALERQVAYVWERYRQPVLVEQYIDGREIYVAKLDGGREEASCILPLFEVDFGGLAAHHPRVVTFEAKWREESAAYHGTPTRPAELPAAVVARIEAVGRAAFAALDVRDYGRVDVRLADDGTPYVIDVNPNCDLSSVAGFAKAALEGGRSYEALIQHIARLALARKHADTIPLAPRSRRPRDAAVGPTRQPVSRRRGGVRAGSSRGGPGAT